MLLFHKQILDFLTLKIRQMVPSPQYLLVFSTRMTEVNSYEILHVLFLFIFYFIRATRVNVLRVNVLI